MNPEQMRIAIAEKCGKHRWEGDPQERDCSICGAKPPADVHHIPNYPSDLNAMHEAEKILNSHDRFNYACELERVVHTALGDTKSAWEYSMATALQRAEAFCRATGIWKD